MFHARVDHKPTASLVRCALAKRLLTSAESSYFFVVRPFFAVVATEGLAVGLTADWAAGFAAGLGTVPLKLNLAVAFL